MSEGNPTKTTSDSMIVAKIESAGHGGCLGMRYIQSKPKDDFSPKHWLGDKNINEISGVLVIFTNCTAPKQNGQSP